MNQDIEILRYLAKKDKQIEKLYNKLIYQLSKVSLNITKIREGAFFSFDDYPEIKERVDEILDSYRLEQQEMILGGIRDAVKTSFKANAIVLSAFTRYSDKALRDMRDNAANSFIQTRVKPKEGLSLSQKVWNYTRQAKAEFEAGMSEILEDGLSAGMSAEELGRKVRDKLKVPDMVYRRYHVKKLTATGKKDAIEWRRKVIDSEGKVRYVKEDLEKVGRGVYRSSRKNALRLTATEINMAYRYADNVRWQAEPFVIGFRIQLSGNHTLNGKPFHDMCDELVGDYPKWFRWGGWHPRCRCIATPILVPKEEMMKISTLPEEEYKRYRSPNLITKMPQNYDAYVEENRDRILASMDRGTSPYWVRDNYKDGDIDKGFYWTGRRIKTEEHKKAIQAAWDARKRKNAIQLAAQKRHANRDAKAIQEVWDKRRRKQSILAAAEKRHAKRDAVAIQKAWDERKARYAKLKKIAGNVYMASLDYPWVNTTNLEFLMMRKKYHLLEDEYKKVARRIIEVRNQRNELSKLIPNIDEWMFDYSYGELKVVYDEFDDVMTRWLSKYNYSSFDAAPLEHLKNKLKFELTNPTIKYSNKEAIDRVIKEHIQLIDRKIEWNDMLAKVATLKSFKTKSSAYKLNLAHIDNAIASNDFNALQKSIANAEKQQMIIINQQIKRSGKATNALNKEYKGTAVGQDITSSIDCRNMATTDSYGSSKRYTNEIARLQGYDAPAKLVSEQEFALLEKSCGEVFYRTVNPTKFNGKDMTGEEFASQMYVANRLEMNGFGMRAYGDGIYVATASWDGEKINPISDNRKKNAYAESYSYGRSGCKISEMTFTRKPKIILQTELRAMWQKLSISEMAKYGNHENTYACALGYDAMYCEGPNYMVIWNRSIIAVKKK